jgi:hypothetical protein
MSYCTHLQQVPPQTFSASLHVPLFSRLHSRPPRKREHAKQTPSINLSSPTKRTFASVFLASAAWSAGHKPKVCKPQRQNQRHQRRLLLRPKLRCRQIAFNTRSLAPPAQLITTRLTYQKSSKTSWSTFRSKTSSSTDESRSNSKQP